MSVRRNDTIPLGRSRMGSSIRNALTAGTGDALCRQTVSHAAEGPRPGGRLPVESPPGARPFAPSQRSERRSDEGDSRSPAESVRARREAVTALRWWLGREVGFVNLQ